MPLLWPNRLGQELSSDETTFKEDRKMKIRTLHFASALLVAVWACGGTSEPSAVATNGAEIQKLLEAGATLEKVGETEVTFEKNAEGKCVSKTSTQLYNLLPQASDIGTNFLLPGSRLEVTCSGSCSGSGCWTEGCSPSGNACTPLSCKSNTGSSCSAGACTKTTKVVRSAA